MSSRVSRRMAFGEGTGAWPVVVAVCMSLAAAVCCADEAAAPQRLRVGVVPIEAAVEYGGSQPTGVAIDLWEDLARRLGTATEYVRLDRFDECLPAVAEGRVDVFVGPFAITEERERIVDFTHPVMHSGLRIAIRQRNESGFLAAFGSLLTWDLLALIGLLVGLAVLTGYLLWFFERHDNPEPFPKSYVRGVWEATWWSVSTMVTGGCENKPVSTALGRAIALAWMLGGIVLVASFTSALTATMTAERVAGSIQGPRDLQGRTVACQKAAVSVQAVRQRGGVVEEFDTVADCIEAVALGMAEAAVSENHCLMHVISRSGREGFRLVGGVFESFDFGMAVPSGSPLRERINTTLLQMREDGAIDRILAEWVGKHE